MQFLKIHKYNTKKTTLLFINLICFFLLAVSVNAQKKYTVVLDAGHGGKDPGNLGNGFKEKDIALKVVLEVGERLKNDKNIKVLFTRKSDKFIELHNRAKVANENKADLFVSVHCDAFHKSDPHGAGTFVLGLRGNKGNFEIAKRENAVILLEDDYKQNYDYDPNSPESVIGLSVLQEENLDLSLNLAGLIQNNFTDLRRYDRSVKQDNFLVLRETVMPSVLIELGFLTNKAEGQFLNSKAGQQKMAEAIAKAITNYINTLRLNTVQEIVVNQKGATIEVDKKENSSAVNKEEKEQKDLIASTDTKVEPKKTIEPKISVILPVEKKEEEIKELHKKEEVVPTVVNTSKTFTLPYIEFKVQIAASKKYIPAEPYNFKGLQNIEMMQFEEYYKYYYGRSSDYQEINKVLHEAKKAGHTGAFVVAFKDGVKIPLYEALKKQ